jgi:hypothetical protein
LLDENILLGAFHLKLDKIKNNGKNKEIDDTYFANKFKVLLSSNCKLTFFSELIG